MPHTVVQHVQCTRLALALVLTGIVLPFVLPDEAMLFRLAHGPAGLVALITLSAIRNWTNSLYPYTHCLYRLNYVCAVCAQPAAAGALCMVQRSLSTRPKRKDRLSSSGCRAQALSTACARCRQFCPPVAMMVRDVRR